MRWEFCHHFGKTLPDLREEWPLWQSKILALAAMENRKKLKPLLAELTTEAINEEGSTHYGLQYYIVLSL